MPLSFILLTPMHHLCRIHSRMLHLKFAFLLLSLCISVINCLEAYIVEAVVYQNPISCWTCPNQTGNNECNSWAPEEKCLKNYTLCQTIHRIQKASGQSLSVIKRCALPSECAIDMIGCHDTNIPGIQDCVSCCNYPLCNEFVPSNYSRALHYSRVYSNSSSHYSVLLTLVFTMTGLVFVIANYSSVK